MWEYPGRNLSDELTERVLQKRNFEERELWSILASCILGMSILQKNNVKHDALTAKTLLLSNEGTPTRNYCRFAESGRSDHDAHPF